MLELQVWDFELPEKSHLKPNIHTDTEINTFPEEMEVKYYQLLRKGLRRGSQDYKYFWLLSQGKGAKEMVDGALEAVLHGSIDEKASLGQPGTWLHDPDEWDRVRLKFGEAIEKIRKDAASAARVR
jgi:hypothetical protein